MEFDVVKIILTVSSVIGALLAIKSFGGKVLAYGMKKFSAYFQKALIEPLKNFIVDEFAKVSDEICSLKKEIKTDKEVSAHFFKKRIIGSYDEYMARGEITSKQKTDFLLDLDMYKANGFNGIEKHIREDINRLPVVGEYKK